MHAEESDVVNVSCIVGADAGEITEDLLLQAPALHNTAAIDTSWRERQP